MRITTTTLVLAVASWLVVAAVATVVWTAAAPARSETPHPAITSLCASVGSLAERAMINRQLGYSLEQQLEVVGTHAPETTIDVIERAYEYPEDHEAFADWAESECLRATTGEETSR